MVLKSKHRFGRFEVRFPEVREVRGSVISGSFQVYFSLLTRLPIKTDEKTQIEWFFKTMKKSHVFKIENFLKYFLPQKIKIRFLVITFIEVRIRNHLT